MTAVIAKKLRYTGVTEFLVLDGVYQCPLLALSPANPQDYNPETYLARMSSIGFLLLVYFPLLLDRHGAERSRRRSAVHAP